MDTNRILGAFAQLGKAMGYLGTGDAWPGESIGLTKEEYEQQELLISTATLSNGWFTEDNVRHAYRALASMLNKDELQHWANNYSFNQHEPKQVGIIMAGNIPMVGFHDLLCVIVSGNKAVVKYSSDDDRLLPGVLSMLFLFAPELAGRVEVRPDRIGDVDAIIATGSNNSARYFEHYFGHLPHIIRKNRNAVAILTGDESEDELKGIGEDVFRYFGLGCRNVSKLYLHKDFDLDRFFAAVFDWHPIGEHSKYANNYDYHKALWLMDGADLIENGFLLLKEDKLLSSPVASLYYERFDDTEQLGYQLKALDQEIQCVVGHGRVPFGKAQQPRVADYADGVDTMKFLTEL